MKFIMVIIICFGANCQTIWDKQLYSTVDDCLAASTPVREYMMQVYPTSAGQIYCMSEEEFINFKKNLEEGGKNTGNLESPGKI